MGVGHLIAYGRWPFELIAFGRWPLELIAYGCPAQAAPLEWDAAAQTCGAAARACCRERGLAVETRFCETSAARFR